MTFERIIHAILTVLSVLWIRTYRAVDNLLTGSPVWYCTPVRHATATQRGTHLRPSTKVATE
ncbi:hypothetical protein ACIRQP_39600 [Streptomyces sp. NPDC102274]|uniref:hypothetical protein n=1 Tax=Streptomyces sp. NPDC102274 TaxID=3366151 RepID=UPI0037F28AD6